jgi:hypothetical protein
LGTKLKGLLTMTAMSGLGCRGTIIEKLGNGGNKLRWRKWFGQEDAVGHTLNGPILGRGTGDIDDGQRRIECPGAPRDVPSLYAVFTQLDIDYEYPVLVCAQQRQRLLAR